MADQIKEVLYSTVAIEIAYDTQRDFIYPARIKLITNSELDLVLSNDELQKVPFKEGDRLFVTLKTRECCYNFSTICTYTKKTNMFYMSIKAPVKLERTQYREFIRVQMKRDISFYISSDGLYKERVDAISAVSNQQMKIHLFKAQSIDISAGGIAFYFDKRLNEMANVIIDMSDLLPDMKELRQHGVVLRCRPHKLDNRENWKVAVRFVNMPFAVQEKLNHFVFELIREQAKKEKALR